MQISLLIFLAIHSLQGALGKTAGRSYKAAPRQLLQMDINGHDASQLNAHGHISKEDAKENTAGAAKEAAKRGREALGTHAGEVSRSVLILSPFVDIHSAFSNKPVLSIRTHFPEDKH